MEEKLEMATKELQSNITNISSNINGTIATAMAKALGDAQKHTTELKEAVRDASTTADRLSGDIKNASDEIQRLRVQAQTIKLSAEDANAKAAKAYLDSKSKIDAAQSTVLKDIKEVIDSVAELKIKPMHQCQQNRIHRIHQRRIIRATKGILSIMQMSFRYQAI